ncbi:MAG: tetratricopeptide repeat protein [Armatimonadota bacterium]
MWPFGRRRQTKARDDQALLREATRALEQGRAREAIEALADLVQEDPENFAARVNLGTAYYSTGEYVAAARQFEVAHELKPTNPKVLLNLAAARSALDQLDDAIDLLLEALQVDPQMRDVHYNLAIAYWRKGRMPEAMAELEMELALHPDHQAAKSAAERIRAEAGLDEGTTQPQS